MITLGKARRKRYLNVMSKHRT